VESLCLHKNSRCDHPRRSSNAATCSFGQNQSTALLIHDREAVSQRRCIPPGVFREFAQSTRLSTWGCFVPWLFRSFPLRLLYITCPPGNLATKLNAALSARERLVPSRGGRPDVYIALLAAAAFARRRLGYTAGKLVPGCPRDRSVRLPLSFSLAIEERDSARHLGLALLRSCRRCDRRLCVQ